MILRKTHKSIKRIILVIGMFFFVLLPGCWDSREINQVSIISSLGLDLSPESRLDLSIRLVQPILPRESSTPKSFVINSQGWSAAEAARRVTLSIGRVPDWSNMRSILISDKLASEDLLPAVDFLSRNRFVRPDTPLYVTKGCRPADIQSSKLPLDISGIGLGSLLNNNRETSRIYVSLTVIEFMILLRTPGIEPAIPQLVLSSNIANINSGNEQQDSKDTGSLPDKSLQDKNPHLDGMAVFKGAKMVGSLDDMESEGFRWLKDYKTEKGYLAITSPANSSRYVEMGVTDFTSFTKPEVRGGQVKMLITIQADLSYYGQQGSENLLNSEYIPQIEAAAAAEISRQISACIEKAKYLNSDIMGWGRLLSEKHPHVWKDQSPDWDRFFPETPYEIKVQTTLKESFSSEDSLPYR